MKKNHDPLDAPEIRYRFKRLYKRAKRNGIEFLFNRKVEIDMCNEWLKIRHEFI